MKRQVRLGWLPVVQLVMSGILVATGLWLYFNESPVSASQTQASVRIHPRPRPAPVPTFTFPSGGRTIFPQHRLVALYGSPGEPVLGSLGQQNLPAAITRVQQLSKQYQPYMHERALPTFEIIATVASGNPTDNQDYSREINQQTLQQWVTAAQQAGIYVVLDLQPGRADFLTQAKRLSPLLSQPNVGLALDPEWRLRPNQIPLAQVGAVSIKEVNDTAAWLAGLTRTNHLPQKLFLLHQFRNDMLPARIQLDTSHPELAYAIQMDGQGTQAQKQATWRAILRQPPAGVRFGWKNFYVKDPVLLTPAQTMALQPEPWYISYQ